MGNHAHSERLLRDWLVNAGLSPQIEIRLLLGDGSTRCFYRISDPVAKTSWILISDPEWKQSQDYSAHQDALVGRGLPAPHFQKVDPQTGLLLMQDLGDELLQLRIQKSPSEGPKWLKQSAELLAHLHGKLFPVPKDLPVTTRRFDTEKYYHELCFTLDHLRVGYLKLPEREGQALQAIQSFCAQLDGLGPQVFCHRDYHCRNLLVHQEQLWIIDFQDARLGPPGYDLASLVFDAYTPISGELRSELIEAYKKVLGQYAVFKAVDWNRFESDLLKIAYQRTLKAAGSFASFWTKNKKETHLRYIEPALRLAQLCEASGGIPAEVAAAFEIDTMIEALHEK